MLSFGIRSSPHKKTEQVYLSIELQLDFVMFVERELVSRPDGLVGQREEQEVVEEEGHQLLAALRLAKKAVVKKLARTHLLGIKNV